MTGIIVFIAFVAACFYVLGAIFGLPHFKRRRVARRTIPLARTLSRAESRRLELPREQRRQAVRTALGWEQADAPQTTVPQ